MSEDTVLLTQGYTLKNKLGEGSHATVYLAEYDYHNRSNGNKVVLACKIIDTLKAPKEFVSKFLPRELNVLIRISHPYIIHVYSIFQKKNEFYIFMRYAEQGDLLEYVLKGGPLPEAHARVWLRQIALAVQYLHDMNIVHRDLKCENILITSNYNVKLCDFGFARYVSGASGHDVMSETYCGSLSYAAPEVLRGTPYNPRSADVWSVGVILFVMLNKAMPFDDTNVKKLRQMQKRRRWKFREKIAQVVSVQVKKLMKNLLNPDVTQRYRIEDVLASDWIAMDPRLTELSHVEEVAMLQAQRHLRLRNENKYPIDPLHRLVAEDLNVLKEVNEQERNAGMKSLSTPSLAVDNDRIKVEEKKTEEIRRQKNVIEDIMDMESDSGSL